MSASIVSGGTPPDLEGQASQGDSVRGERNTLSVNGGRSLQSRVSGVLAAGLMIALGVGGLSWYYANALSRQNRAHQVAASAATNSAQGDMALPPLGGVPAPLPPSQSPQPDVVSGVNSDPSLRGRVTATSPDLIRPAEARVQSWSDTGVPLPPYTGAMAYSQPPRPVPEDRRLSGAAFTRDPGQSDSTSNSGSGVASATGAAIAEAARGSSLSSSANRGDTNRGEDTLTTLLRPGVATPARAQTLPTQQFLLPKGAFIDCTLETAIDSTLPGMTTCVTATDTFGVDGKVVLLERGSKLVGETRGEVQNGSARVFVLWTEARTPTGVLAPLDSPGTDELGRSGLPGEVNRHFWDRFGAAVLVSVIDGAVQAAAQSTNRGGSAVIFNPSTSQDALTEVLKGSINIAPTITKHQGDRIQILVARDLDFRTVYELRTAGH
jgi:type IV secretion system protein VirB10